MIDRTHPLIVISRLRGRSPAHAQYTHSPALPPRPAIRARAVRIISSDTMDTSDDHQFREAEDLCRECTPENVYSALLCTYQCQAPPTPPRANEGH